jgi:hypothetical protein
MEVPMCRVLLLIPLALAACASPCRDRYVSGVAVEITTKHIELVTALATNEICLVHAAQQGNAALAANLRQQRVSLAVQLQQLETTISTTPPVYQGCPQKCCQPHNPKKCGCSRQCPCWGSHPAS